VLAELSDDDGLKDACMETDIHLEMARRLFNAPALEKGDMVEVYGHKVKGRYTAKQAGFAIVYGAKPESISKLFGVPLEIANKVVDFVETEFPKINQWAQGQISKAQRVGYVETIAGRRRWFEFLDPKSIYKSMNMIRNHPVQGSSADMIKLAIILTDEKLRELPAWVSMIIHDEIVVHCKGGYEERVASILEEAMLEAGHYYIDVPTPVDYEISNTWEKP